MYQNYTINQLCLPIDLEAKIEENDFVHAIVQFVDSIPDAVFLPYYQSMGRPQYHPRMLLSVILCAYIQGVYSGRQIQNMLIDSIRMRYLSQDQIPNFRTINRFRVHPIMNDILDKLEGNLSKKIKQIKQQILDVMVNVEVSIDYPEYDTPDATENEILNMLNNVEKELLKLENSFDNGKLIKEGIKTAIIGKPNAGKSSLLNAILDEDRAIVTNIEGTTRDTIEEFVNINGIPLNLIDTAGIRNTTNEVEQIGVKKSKKIAQDADLIIAIFDATKDLSKEDMEILDIIKDKKIIIVLNKIDLPCKIDENNEYLKSITNNIVKISALNNIGIEEIYNKITKMFNLNEINLDNEIVITNLRHKNLIHKAMENVEKAKQSLNENMPSDIVAIFIKDILESLGEITGEEVTENIINEIFSRFCLGK